MATLKQKRAALKSLENGGNVSRAMIDVGYSKAMAKNPQKLTQSKGWNELIEKYLKDEELLKVHKAGLGATTLKPHLIDRDDKGRPIYDYVPEDDMPTRKQYLELGYKVKGKLQPEIQINSQVNYNEVTNKQKDKYGI